MLELPIDRVLPDVRAALAAHRACVLVAPPGSGKTTRVPGAIVDAGGIDGEVWVLQPRRLAARAAARRVAQERGGRIGEEVGYQVRFDKQVSEATRIRFVTEGILVRQLVSDPFLPGIGAVVLDEFHERSIEADLALAMLAEVRATVREDLQLVVMSATLDGEAVAEYLGGCPTVHAEGRRFEVDVEYQPGTGPLPPRVRAGVLAGAEATAGDILVFLPGVGEIQACRRELSDTAKKRGWALHGLHGRLSADEQDAAIRPGERRKVVLATNVAETSVTIEGVTAVVDSGQARVLRHDAGRGLDRLELTSISRASATQRSGRAGRTGPGTCYRLWSLAEERGMPAYELPEIRRLDLASVVLQVRSFAGREPGAFDWFEAPEAASLARADELLELLGAVVDGQVTKLGHAMLRHPVAPRLARMLEEGARVGLSRSAALLAALLSEREIQGRRSGAADLLTTSEMFTELEAARFDPRLARELGIDVAAAQTVARVRDQLARGREDRVDAHEADLVKMLVAAYPDRVSRRADEHSIDGVMASGRGCRLEMQDHEALGTMFLALRVREKSGQPQSRSLVSLGCALEEAWLREVFPEGVVEHEETELDAKRGAVAVFRRRRFGRLILEERVGGVPDAVVAERLLAEELARDPWRYLGKQPDLRAFLSRLAWLRQHAAEADLPDIGDAEVAAAAVTLCAGRWRLADLKEANVLAVLKGTLPHGVAQRIARDAPERIELPSGRKAKIDYDSGAEPLVAARLQEFFGLPRAPALAGGRVPLLLHLLAPNHRPVQITRDLASFWVNTYPDVRKELKRRYPKHSWPEDPLAAQAEARPSRRPKR